MTQSGRIYLDNAATSWPKPEQVYLAMDHFQRTNGAPAGRSVYTDAIETQRLIDAARLQLAEFFGAPKPQHAIFASNGTDALNMAIHGALRPGDHVIASVVEHNSVLRPLRYWQQHHGVELTLLPCNVDGVVSLEDVRTQLRPATRLVTLNHVSNVTGAGQRVADVGELLKDHPALFLVDAAQSAGHFPVDIRQIGCNMLATPGHKGLLGPLGTGVLILDDLAAQQLRPLRQGGTGTRSESDEQPDSLPERLESGNLNVPGIVGLAAGLQHIASQTLEKIAAHEAQLTERLAAGLQAIPGVSLHVPRQASQRSGVVSFTLDGYDPQEIAALLDSNFGVQGRSGLHCAPRMHEALGTLASGGTMRLSLGLESDADQIDVALAAVQELVS